MYSHVLTIGCTGMLLEAAATLAAQCRTVTSVARTAQSLHALDDAVAHRPCIHHTLALDWATPDAFVAAVAAGVRRTGHPDLVLAWLHDDQLGPQLARALATPDQPCAFFQVRGSAATNPAKRAGALLGVREIPSTIAYHQIILGFHADDGGSRWLHDPEICAGVLAAIDRPTSVTIVGSVAPWSNRP